MLKIFSKFLIILKLAGLILAVTDDCVNETCEQVLVFRTGLAVAFEQAKLFRCELNQLIIRISCHECSGTKPVKRYVGDFR